MSANTPAKPAAPKASPAAPALKHAKFMRPLLHLNKNYPYRGLMHTLSIYLHRALSTCALHSSFDPLSPWVNERSSPVCPFNISWVVVVASLPLNEPHAPAVAPWLHSWCFPPSVASAQSARPVTNYQTNEPSRRRQMRKNRLWRGPFIQIPPDSVEALIPFLSLSARGNMKSGREEGNQIGHFPGL